MNYLNEFNCNSLLTLHLNFVSLINQKWPMRSRLYAKPESNNLTTTINKTSTLTPQATCSTINDYIDCSSDYNCYLFDKIDPFKCDDWNGIDLNMFYEDFNSLTSFPNFQ